MSLALYRKYRSKSLDEIVGQTHVTDILKGSIKQGRIAHAYLLTGPRGVGKTSIARILAHEINDLPYDGESTHLDIIEIDAASNNGVDDVRDLREKALIAPVSAKKKIYIIDEVHMLSKSAFNALLKTLEEPPEHVVFILATTDVEKLPATIISRTQRFGFRPIKTEDAVKHLSHIAKKEGIKVTSEALELIAEHGDGSFRDSISLLDQLSNLASDDSGITAELIESTIGMAPSKAVAELLDAAQNGRLEQIVSALDKLRGEGVSSIQLAKQLQRAINRDISENPQLLPLLDSLVEVSRSPHPEIKLLTVLGSFAPVKNSAKNAALRHIAPEIKVEIENLPAHPKPKAKQQSPKAPTEKFNWQALIDYTRSNQVALYSVLSKCGYMTDEGVLTLYTKNTFYKKKLDDPKYRSSLSECMENSGCGGYEVVTLATAPPPKDSQAAAVAAIMGGGEEITLE